MNDTAELSEAMISRNGIRVNPRIWKAAVAKAKAQDRSVTSVMRLLLEGYVRGTFKLPG